MEQGGRRHQEAQLFQTPLPRVRVGYAPASCIMFKSHLDPREVPVLMLRHCTAYRMFRPHGLAYFTKNPQTSVPFKSKNS